MISLIRLVLIIQLANFICCANTDLQDITSRTWTVDDLLFSEDLFPGHIIPQSMLHSEAIKMFNVLLDDHNLLSEAYSKYRVQHNKEVETVKEMEEMRKMNFKHNLHFIFDHNLKADSGRFRFQVGVNMFADMTKDEMRDFLGANDKMPAHPHHKTVNSSHSGHQQPSTFGSIAFPPSFDLRDETVLPPMKNQGKCGSCVFFSVAGLIETLYAIKTGGDKINVSEQMMLDCATPENGYVNNAGCNGNIMEDTLQFVQDHGLTSESLYKYQAKQENCTMKDKEIVAQLKEYWQVEDSVEAFKDTLVNRKAPIATAYLVYQPFMFYRTGVYDFCSPPQSYVGGHAVLIIGYGQFFDTGYWLVKNSWGVGWGEAGYFRYVMGSRSCLMERWGFTGTLV